MEDAGHRGFDLEARVGRWRARHERISSLSPRELDELEDHLRARVALLVETRARLTPKQAFAVAAQELGKAEALSGEFAKSGKLRWRKLLLVGWALYAVSFLLPVSQVYWTPESAIPGLRTVWGWQAFVGSFLTTAGNPISLVSGLSNALVLATFLKLRGTRPPESTWLVLGLIGAAVLNLYWVSAGDLDIGIGYWAWVASFACIGSALWIRARERAPAKPATPARTSGTGVVE